MSKLPDHIVIDLSRKVGADVSDRIRTTAMLVDEPGDVLMIAVSASATALGWAAAAAVGVNNGNAFTPEQLIDGLWTILRPMALKAAGGDEGDFRKLLEQCRGHR